MNNLLSIKEASELLNVTTSILRRWEREGKFISDERIKGNQRRYNLSSIRPETLKNRQVNVDLLKKLKEVEKLAK
jgi:DNA-binding transcriptional MerR regulator